MAKRTTKKEEPDDTPDAPEVPEPPDDEPADEPEGPKESEPEPAEIAVDYGDGEYRLMPAPNGVVRAISIVLDGTTYVHVAEHKGRWAYRAVP